MTVEVNNEMTIDKLKDTVSDKKGNSCIDCQHKICLVQDRRDRAGEKLSKDLNPRGASNFLADVLSLLQYSCPRKFGYAFCQVKLILNNANMAKLTGGRRI